VLAEWVVIGVGELDTRRETLLAKLSGVYVKRACLSYKRCLTQAACSKCPSCVLELSAGVSARTQGLPSAIFLHHPDAKGPKKPFEGAAKGLTN